MYEHKKVQFDAVEYARRVAEDCFDFQLKESRLNYTVKAGLFKTTQYFGF